MPAPYMIEKRGIFVKYFRTIDTTIFTRRLVIGHVMLSQIVYVHHHHVTVHTFPWIVVPRIDFQFFHSPLRNRSVFVFIVIIQFGWTENFDFFEIRYRIVGIFVIFKNGNFVVFGDIGVWFVWIGRFRWWIYFDVISCFVFLDKFEEASKRWIKELIQYQFLLTHSTISGTLDATVKFSDMDSTSSFCVSIEFSVFSFDDSISISIPSLITPQLCFNCCPSYSSIHWSTRLSWKYVLVTSFLNAGSP